MTAVANAGASQPADLQTISAQISQLTDLFTRRLFEDKNTKQLVQSVNASLERRDAIDSRKAFAPMIKEILLAMDRLSSGEPSQELNQSVVDELITILDRYGVTAIENHGKMDPKVHEVVGVSPENSGLEPGTIVEVIRPGYMLGGTVLRTSQVMIAK